MLQRDRFVGGAMYVDAAITNQPMSRIYIAPDVEEIQIIMDSVEDTSQRSTKWAQCTSCYLIYDAITLKQVCPHCCGLIPPNVIVSYRTTHAYS